MLQTLNFTQDLTTLPAGKLLINTINAWSYVVACKDDAFAEALKNGDVLIPDGQSIIWATRFLGCKDAPCRRIAGWDLFVFEMERLEREARNARCRRRVMFLGSSGEVLESIRQRAAKDYPMLEVHTYSPPFKDTFSDQDSAAMADAVNAVRPDLLWIGMTAPKQEKWTYMHWNRLDINCHCGTVGAVFDFYAGKVARAPLWMQKSGLEWLFRLLSSPARMWRRYIVGNSEFIFLVLKEKAVQLFR